MLQTLLKIGRWQSEGKSKWDRFLDYPKAEKVDKNGNAVKNYTLPIIFDLDENEVIIKQDNLEEYDKEKIIPVIPLKVRGRRNKAIYAAITAKKIIQIYKTFFGKEGDETKNGELIEAIAKENPKLVTTNMNTLLSKIFELKNHFLELTALPNKGKVDIRAIHELFDFKRNEKIIFVLIKIKSTELGFKSPTLFSEIPEYKIFLEQTYFSNDSEKQKNVNLKLCYADGKLADDVKKLNLPKSYSLNKMFVTTTKNSASQFDKKKFSNNYQVSAKNQEYLDYASDYLLNNGYTVRIAGLDHVIIPEFQNQSEIDLEMALMGINRKSDLIFNVNRLKILSEDIVDELKGDEIYWLNFMAFESDGNFFKTTEIIKDVSNFHFNKIINTFYSIEKQFKDSSFVDWNTIMTEYDFDTKDRQRHYLNFNSLFKIVPLKQDKDKIKKNKALELFKTILENRTVQRELLYDYFNELILCHYYGRYTSYNNVQDFSQKGKRTPSDYFVWACRDAVFKYHAFIQFLKELKLIDMEDSMPQTKQEPENKYEKAIFDFFNEMNLTKNQKAMFYLGRMLNRVEYLQEGKNMTVIRKVNFNGMDRDDIQRLRIGLIEKAKQYNALNQVIFIDNKFGQYFNYNDWGINPNEAIFFLLTGYSFGVGIKKIKEEPSSIENN